MQSELAAMGQDIYVQLNYSFIGLGAELRLDSLGVYRLEEAMYNQLSFGVNVGVSHVLFSRESIGSLQWLDPHKVLDKFQLVIDCRCIFVNHRNMCLLKPKVLHHLFLPVRPSHHTFNTCHYVEFMRLFWVTTVFLMFF